MIQNLPVWCRKHSEGMKDGVCEVCRGERIAKEVRRIRHRMEQAEASNNQEQAERSKSKSSNEPEVGDKR